MTDKPNYNDGNWHGWNGGECPVHPKSVVEAVWHDAHRNTAGITGPRQAVEEGLPRLAWSHVVRFRVVKEHREPREFWLMTEDGIVRSHSSIKPDAVRCGWKCIHVREVLK